MRQYNGKLDEHSECARHMIRQSIAIQINQTESVSRNCLLECAVPENWLMQDNIYFAKTLAGVGWFALDTRYVK